MDFTNQTPDHNPVHKLVLSIISYCGCILSVIVCLFAGLGYELARRCAARISKNESKMTNILYEAIFFSIFAADLTFLIGIQRTENTVVCSIIAALLHYFLLLQYEFMMAIGVFYVIVFTCQYKVAAVDAKCRWLMMVLCVLPLSIVVITVSVTQDDYVHSSGDICWLSVEHGIIWAFVGPLSTLLFINCCLLVKLFWSTEQQSANHKQMENTDANKRWILSRKKKYRMEFTLAMVLGVTWIVAYLQIFTPIVTSYFFTIFNAYQGLIVCAVCGSWHRMKDGYAKFIYRHYRFFVKYCPCIASYRAKRQSRSSVSFPNFSASRKDTQSSSVVLSSYSKCPVDEPLSVSSVDDNLLQELHENSWHSKLMKIPYIDRDSVILEELDHLEDTPHN